MLATLLLSGLVLAEPGTTISYHKKVMIDPDYKPSRTAEEIRETLDEARRPVRVVRPLSAVPVRRVVYAAEPVVYGSAACVPAPRARWSVGVAYAGSRHGWGTGVGFSYGYPTTYAYAYPRYDWSCGSPWTWSLGLGYRTSWGAIGLGWSRAWSCGPRYGHGHGRRLHR